MGVGDSPVIDYIRVSGTEHAEKRHSVPVLFSMVLTMTKATLPGMLC